MIHVLRGMLHVFFSYDFRNSYEVDQKHAIKQMSKKGYR